MFSELWRITSFRLTVLYGALFALAVAVLLGLVYAETANYQDRQVDQLLTNEGHAFSIITGEELAGDIAYEIKRDARHINYYGVFTPDGRILAGNLKRVPSNLKLDGEPRRLDLTGNEDLFTNGVGIRALGKIAMEGNTLVVARDMALLEQIRGALLRGCFAIGAVILLLGILGGVFYSVPAVRHIQQIDEATRRIMNGDYSQRLPLGRRNHELDALAAIVNAMLDETERLMGEVKSYSDNIAHDLRTPMTRLRASIYRGQQLAEEESNVRQMLDQALTDTDLLLSRFRALSRISEIESKRRRAGFDEVPLEPILRQIEDLYEPLASQSGVKLTLKAESNPVIECDGELLFEAIGNLVDNAIKFTPVKGEVEVALEETVSGPVIAVSDSGPGIPVEQRKAVLQRFYRVADTRNVPGSGLGLSLVDAIARLHGFTLTLDEAPGGGTRVSLQCWTEATAVT